MNRRRVVGLGLTLGLLALTACRSLERTDDGVVIVPFDSGTETVGVLQLAGASLEFSAEAWTNRMPGPAPRGSDQKGFPLHVALRIRPTGQANSATEIRVTAISLWSKGGDSLWAAFALEQPDGSAPVLTPVDPLSKWELTDDRDRPRYSLIAEDTPVVPMVLIEQDSRQHILRLAELQVIAAY